MSASTADELAAAQGDAAALRVEYESRAAWIAKMLPILGCENKDGFNCKDAHATASALMADLAAAQGERDAANQHCKILMAANYDHARLIEQQMKELAALREDKVLLDKLDALISTEQTQRLFLLPTRRDCNSIREALRVATSCHVPEEAK